MKIKEAEFVISNTDIKKCPQDEIPEFAFIGRSNVGKSSLINMLCDIKGLAKTSSQPGKTQCINHFSINKKQMYWVDLPGYGYARISLKEREKWQKMIQTYILKRPNLLYIFVLVDGRIPAQKSDVEFINWLGENNIPLAIVITKADKESITLIRKNTESLKKALLVTWASIPPLFLSSALTGAGKVDMLTFMEQSLQFLQEK